MLCLKKVYTEDLLQLAILLSLLRTHRNVDWAYNAPMIGIGGDDMERALSNLRNELHPKSYDSALFDFEEQVFRDLNSLGRYSRTISDTYQNVTAYIGLTPHASTSADSSYYEDELINFEGIPFNIDDDDLYSVKQEPDDSELTQEVFMR